ncbi:MAG: hypothetical protein QNK35_12695 [Bacteroides sp.]|nr:hypothetical protein [Bacteroides sp.]
MKLIKYIFIGMVILSMTLGSFSNIIGQEVILFSETYKSKEVVEMLDQEDEYFTLLSQDLVKSEGSMLGTCAEADADAVWSYLHSKEIQKHMPKDLSFAWGLKSKEGKLSLYALRESPKAAPKQKDLNSVSMQESKREGNYDLLLTFSKEGADNWARMTKENVGRNIAIVLDGKVVAAPMVRQEITQGKCMISGDFSKTEASEMKALLED